MASIEALNYELKSDEEPLTKWDDKICCIRSGAMFFRLPQENTWSVLFISSIQKDWGNHRMFITSAISINPTGKAKNQLQGFDPVGHTQLAPWDSLLYFQPPQLSAMTFWLCHHGLISKLLPFRSSLKTFFSSW